MCVCVCVFELLVSTVCPRPRPMMAAAGIVSPGQLQPVRAVQYCIRSYSADPPGVYWMSLKFLLACQVWSHYCLPVYHHNLHRCKLKNALNNIDLPIEALLCHDVMCCNPDHITAIDRYSNSITQTCLSAANGAIPHVGLLGDSSNRPIPGWSEIVEPAREKSLFWHNIWMECGRPKTGVVADIMRQTRLAYHYSIRKVKRREKDIVADRFAETILNNHSRDFWAEVKRMRGKSSVNSNIVDGCITPDDIAKHFADKYQYLYTSVAYNEDEIRAGIKPEPETVTCRFLP